MHDIGICQINDTKITCQMSKQIGLKMKKLILTLSVTLLSFMGLRAQCDTINTFPWWNNIALNNECWTRMGDTSSLWLPDADSDYLGITVPSVQQVNGCALVSPTFALPDDTAGLILTFHTRRIGTGCTLHILVGTGSRDSLQTYDTVRTFIANLWYQYETDTVDLSAYAGQTVNIAFSIVKTDTRYSLDFFGIGSLSIESDDMPQGTLAVSSPVARQGDTLSYTVTLTRGSDSLLTFTWHSLQLDTTLMTSDPTVTLTYPFAGIDTVSVVVANAFGTIVLSVASGIYFCDTVRTFPWEEDFTTFMGAEADYAACWQMVEWTHTGINATYGFIDEHGGYVSKKDLMVSNGTEGSYLISPPILVPDTIIDNLSVWIHYSRSVTGTILSTTGDSLRVDTLFVGESNNNLVIHTIPLAPYAGQAIRVALYRNHVFGSSVVDRVAVDYDTLPILKSVMVPALGYTDSTLVCSADFRRGSFEGLRFIWHSSLMDTTWVDTSLHSIFNLNYTLGGMDTITVVAANAYGADTVINFVNVKDCSASVIPWNEDFLHGKICWYQPEGSRFFCYNNSLVLTVANDPFSWIMSKEIQLPADTNLMPHLFWKVATSNHNYPLRYSVLVTDSADYTDTANYTLLYTDSAAHITHTRNSDFDTLSLDLTAYAGRSIHLAFHNHSIHLPRWCRLYFDDVEIRSTAAPLVRLDVQDTAFSGDSVLLRASLLEGSQIGTTFTWYSSLLDSVWTTSADSTFIVYSFEGTDILSVTAVNIYGSGSASDSLVVFYCPVMDAVGWNDPIDDNTPLYCWTIWNYGGNAGYRRWSYLSDDIPGTFLKAGYGSNLNNEWLVTPRFAIPDSADGLNIQWLQALYPRYNRTPVLEVRVSVTHANDSTAFTDVIYRHSAIAGDDQFKLASAPLADYAGQTVRLAFVLRGCETVQIDSFSVNYNYLPVAHIEPPQAVFVGDSLTIYATHNHAVGSPTLQWHSVLLDSTFYGESLDVVYPLAGVDTLTLVVSNSYGADTSTCIFPVVAYPLPQLTLTAPDTVIVPDSVVLSASLNGCSRNGLIVSCHSSLLDTTVIWYPDSLPRVTNWEFSYLVGGHDTLTVIAANAYGSDTVMVVVFAFSCHSLPWYEDFEGVLVDYSTITLPSCWDYAWSGYNGFAPHVIDADPYLFNNPDNAFVMLAGSLVGNSASYALLPWMDDTLYKLTMALDYSYESVFHGTLDVGYIDTVDNFVVVESLPSHASSYRRDTISFFSVTIPDARIALRWWTDNDLSHVIIDNIEVNYDTRASAPCPLTVDSIGQTTAHTVWSPVEGATNYHLKVRNGVYTVLDWAVADTVATLTGLPAGTLLSIDVAAIVGGDIGHYCTVSFQTLCGSVSLPLQEDFSGVPSGELPNCWEALWEGSASNSPQVTGSTQHLRMWAMDSLSSEPAGSYVTLPSVNVPLRSTLLELRHRPMSIGMGNLLVGYWNDTSFVSIDTLPNRGHSLDTDTIPLTGIPDSVNRVVLCWYEGSGDENNRCYVEIYEVNLFLDTTLYDTVWRTVTLYCDSTMGSVAGAGVYEDSSMVAIYATPNDGFRFLGWSDGDTNASRTLLLVSDTVLTAYFDSISTPPLPPDTVWRTVVVSANVDGAVETYGSGIYADSSIVEIGYTLVDTAIVGGRWNCLGWSDGSLENPRGIFVTSDTSIVAIFEWVADTTEGINELRGKGCELIIFPNPAHGDVNISVSCPSTIAVLDLTGRSVIPPTTITSSFLIPHSSLSSGVYFVRMSAAEGTVVKKLIKK